ncbi:MAG: hypothetical protein Q8M40_02875 [Legionella sp.]|nr:hypothetical protein [Legionella sp.]
MGQFVTNVLNELEIQLGDYSDEENESFKLVANQLDNLHENLGPLMGGLFAKMYRENLKKNLYVPNSLLPNKLVLALNTMHQKIAQLCESIESNDITKSLKNSSSSNSSSGSASDNEDSDTLDKVYINYEESEEEEKAQADKDIEKDSKKITDDESQIKKFIEENRVECGFDDPSSPPTSPSKKVIFIDVSSTLQPLNSDRPNQEVTTILPPRNVLRHMKLETEVVPYLKALAEHKKDLVLRRQREHLTNQDNYTKAITAIDNILTAVPNLNKKYINNEMTTEDYKKDTKAILEANQSDLKKHRGPKELVINLLAFFGTIGIAHAINRFCLFKCDTNSSKIVKGMEASLNSLNTNS